MEEEFRNGQELVPILLYPEVGQIALIKAWDQQRKNKNVTRETAVSGVSQLKVLNAHRCNSTLVTEI